MIGARRAKMREDKEKKKKKRNKNNNLAFFLCSFYSCFPIP